MLCLLILAGFGCNRQPDNNGPEQIDRDQILFEARKNGLIMNESEVTQMAEVSRLKSVQNKPVTDLTPYLTKKTDGWKSAALADVTGGGSFGLAFSTTESGGYALLAKMGNLPIPQQGYRYEGWLVRRGSELSVIPLGPATQIEEQFVQVFLTQEDISDHDFYVLTLEPDDENPTPAEHILEGTLK